MQADAVSGALAQAILRALAEAPGSEGMSLPRLGKRLGQGASVLMRELAVLGEAAIGGRRGPGWVLLAREDARWVARLTPAGRALVAGWDSADDGQAR